jgi:hypothetical protein
MKFAFQVIWVTLVVAGALVLTSLSGCKRSTTSTVAASEFAASTDNLSDPDEVIDCDAKTCPADIDVIPYVPELRDLQLIAGIPASKTEGLALADDSIDDALHQMRLFNTLAMDDEKSPLLASATKSALSALLTEFVGGDANSRQKIIGALRNVASEAAPVLAKASLSADERTVLQRLATTISSDEFKNSPLARIVQGKLQGNTDSDLSAQLAGTADALRFFNRNIDGSTLARKLEVIERLLGLCQEAAVALERKNQTPSTIDTRTKQILTAAQQFAGEDGWINRGDIHRLTSIFQRLVAKIADEKIAEGYAQGISDLRSQHPFVYRRWVRRPNGLIGRAVNRNIAQKMSEAHSEKMKAISQATYQASAIYESAMQSLGVQRYYLGNDRRSNYIDPGAEMTLATVENIIVAVTGKTSRQLAESGGSGLSAPDTADVQKILSRFTFPDGIFVREALQVAEGKGRLPEGLVFSNTDGGKVRIREYRDMCTCQRLASSNQCAIVFTDKTRNNAKMQYAFASHQAQGCGLAECDAAFVDTRRDSYLPYACAFRYEHKDSGAVRVFR